MSMWIIAAIHAFFGGTNPPVRNEEHYEVWECHKSGDESNGSGVQASVRRFRVGGQGGDHSSHPGSMMFQNFRWFSMFAPLLHPPRRCLNFGYIIHLWTEDRFIPSRRTCVRVRSGRHRLEPAAALLFAETPKATGLTLWFSSGQVNQPNPPWFANSASRWSTSVLLWGMAVVNLWLNGPNCSTPFSGRSWIHLAVLTPSCGSQLKKLHNVLLLQWLRQTQDAWNSWSLTAWPATPCGSEIRCWHCLQCLVFRFEAALWWSLPDPMWNLHLKMQSDSSCCAKLWKSRSWTSWCGTSREKRTIFLCLWLKLYQEMSISCWISWRSHCRIYQVTCTRPSWENPGPWPSPTHSPQNR